MKKITLLLLTIAALNGKAQSTLTTTSQIGFTSQVMIANTATASTVPIGTTGTGLMWDCSNLVQDMAVPTINYTVSSPTGTLYAADYPNANWYFTDPALTALVGHNYKSLNTDSFVNWGDHVTGNSYEIYDDPEIELIFPFAYNQSVSNTYSKTNYNANGSVSSYQTGLITLTYEGNGTLKLPAGTFSDVAKVKRVRTNSLGPTTTTYIWYLASTGEQLLSYSGSNSQVIFKYGAPTSLNEEIRSENQCLFDNNGNISIHSTRPISNIVVTSVDGKKVYSNTQVQSSSFSFKLDGLQNGIYLVHYISNQQQHSKKIIFNK